jgi:hypothetical protein
LRTPSKSFRLSRLARVDDGWLVVTLLDAEDGAVPEVAWLEGALDEAIALEVDMVAGRVDEEAEVEVYCAMTDGANSYKLKAYPPPQTVDFDASPAHRVAHLVEVTL